MDNPAVLDGVANHTSSVLWSTDGDGTFVDNQVPNAIYTPGAEDLINGSVELHILGFGSATCAAFTSRDSVVLTIMELPTALASFSQPSCANDEILFHDLSFTLYGYIAQYVWNYGDGTPNDTIIFPDDPNLTHVYPHFGTYNVTLSVTNSYGCKDDFVFPLEVIPNPIANFYFDGNCLGQMVNFQDATAANGPGNVLAWNWDFGDPASGINNVSDMKNPQHIFSDSGTYSVTLVAGNYNNCSDAMTKLVTIHELPAAAFIHSHVCLGSPANFDPDPVLVNIPSITAWLWDFSDGITSAYQNTLHQFNTPGIYNVTLTITDSLGCANAVSHIIQVNPLPLAHFDAGNNNCSGMEVSFADYSNSPTAFIVRWIWDFGDGNYQTVLQPGNPTINHTYSVAGTYPVLLTVQSADSCWSSELQQIIIKPGAVANFGYSTVPCSSEPVTFTDLTQLNGGGSIVQWAWDFGDPASASANHSAIQNPDHLYSVPGQYTVILNVSLVDGCTSEIQKVITIAPAMAVDFLFDHRCEEHPVQFQPDASIVTVALVNTWHWDFGDGITSPLQAPQHTYATSGSFQVTLTISNASGCSSSITRPVVIIPKPVADFIVSTPVCSQAFTQFTSLSLAPLGYIVKWQWDFGDGTSVIVNSPSSPNVTHLYPNYGSYTAVLTVTTGDSCVNTISKPVVVVPNPLANFSYGTRCLNEAVAFTDLSQSGSGGLSQWAWNFGDPATGSNNFSSIKNATHLFTAAGTFEVQLVAWNSGGCADTVSKQVTIHELPTVNFTSVSGCENDSTHFISSALVNATAVVSRLWDFGDGYTSPEIDPFHIYAATGAYLVTLTVTDTAGCVNSKSYTVAVLPPPVAFFQATSMGCSTIPVNFHDLSNPAGGQFTSCYWEFGDGSDTLINASVFPDIDHTYLVAGTYPVKMKVSTSQGCENTFTKNITISASPLAQFSFAHSCVNSSVDFTNLATANGGTAIMGSAWNFGDPASGINNTSNLQDPQHIYSVADSYQVILQVTNASGCPDTVSHSLTVLPKPPVDYSWTNTCLGTSTGFTVNTTTTNISAIQAYDWDFGDGTTHSSQQDPAHTYSATGNYTAVLTITDTAGCLNSKAYLLSIQPKPTALFSFTSGCVNTSVQFADESYISNGAPVSKWQWNFGVGSAINDTSNLQNPVWVYTSINTYTVSLIATTEGGCQDTAQKTITVAGLPLAGFAYTAAPCHNGAVYFQDSSFSQPSAIVEWNWQFAPNEYSSLKDPVYVFPGVDSCYAVNLTVTNTDGCKNTTTKQVCVPAAFHFSIANSPTCLGSPMEFSSQLLSPITDSLALYSWDFGEPGSGLNNVSTDRKPSHTYSHAGVFTVTLNAVDINNCNGTEYLQVSVSVVPLPAFSFSGGYCDSTITFHSLTNDLRTDLSQLVWNFGDGTTDTVTSSFTAETSHIYSLPGAYTASLSGKNVNGCEASVSDTIRRFPCLYPQYTAADTLVCQNYPLAFADSSTCGGSISSWFWNFGDGSTQSYSAYVNQVIHTYSSPGEYHVKLVISTEIAGKSASDSVVSTVSVSPAPLAGFTTGKTCAGNEVKFNNTTDFGSMASPVFRWTFGDPSVLSDTSLVKDPSYTFASSGSYQVQLVALNSAHCADTVDNMVLVHALPAAGFENSVSCAGYPAYFTNLSDSVEAPIIHSLWTFSRNSAVIDSINTFNSSFSFPGPGLYLVNLQVADSNGCVDTTSKQVETWANPVSSFIYHENYNEVQGQLGFENSSLDAAAYYWDFGNGESSIEAQPTELYKDDGKYTITFVTWNEKGCSDTISSEYTFLVKGLFVPNAFSPDNPKQEVTLFKPVGVNLKEYRLEVFDRWGNLLWSTEKLDAAGRPLEGWDGTCNGIHAQEGNYVWRIHAVFRDDTPWDGKSIGNTDNMPWYTYGTVVLIK
ncbi:MAG: PKD domain-containing protein [Bacteroidota bacterium]